VSREETHVLFSYGTLRQRDVQLTMFGRVLEGRSDAVVGYEVDVLVITDPAVIETSGSDRHPVLRPSVDPHAEVPGMVFSLTDAELQAADRYEVDYERIHVPLRSGNRAWVYAMKS
jgi:hypothetical protein